MTDIITEFISISEEVYRTADWDQIGKDVMASELLPMSALFIVSKMIMPTISDASAKKYLLPFMKFYNIAMAVFSLGCFVACVKTLWGVQLFSDDCDTIFQFPLFVLTVKLFYYSKYVEYIDSWTLMLRGKPVSFLQFFHHLGAPWDMFAVGFFNNESVWIFVTFNSFVHTVMYSYYFLSLYKIRMPLKPLITLLQITQFLTGFYLLWQYRKISCFRNDPTRMAGFLVTYYYVGVVLLLFINFAIQSYILPPKRVSPKKAE